MQVQMHTLIVKSHESGSISTFPMQRRHIKTLPQHASLKLQPSLKRHSSFVSRSLWSSAGTLPGEDTDHQSPGCSCSITGLKLLQSALITHSKVHCKAFVTSSEADEDLPAVTDGGPTLRSRRWESSGVPAPELLPRASASLMTVAQFS